MQITDMPLTNANARPGTRITPKGLVIHWTANEGKGANAAANRNYFNKPTTQASAHYIVDDKQIVRCLSETEMGYHVGAKQYKPDAIAKLSSYPNNCTIGIEMCVNSDGDFKAMYQRTVQLAVDILKRHGWGADKLWRHYDITGKNCPAYFVTDSTAQKYLGLTAAQGWAKFKKDVTALLNPQPTKQSVDKVNIQLNGKLLPVTGILQNGVSWLPIRAVAEAAGSIVGYNKVTKQITVDGQDLTEHIIDSTGYAPARELAKILALSVEWQVASKTVFLK